MDARRVFNEMVVKDPVSWNTLICGYCQMELFEESIELFIEMLRRCRPDLLTVTSILRACGLLQELEFGKFVHDYMTRSGFECDVTASNILIDTYAKCSDLIAARKVFDTMKYRDSVSWNTLINAYVQTGSYSEGVKLFKKMMLELKPDSITYITLLSLSTRLREMELGEELHCNLAKLGFDSDLIVGNALVDMYAKCGKMDDSLKVFENMRVRDRVTWNTVIAACVHAEDCSLGFRMINRMRNEVLPDKATMLGILPICSLIATKRQGKEVHACCFKFGFELAVPVGNALIEMYSKCGNLMYSVRVFEHMKTKDVVTWTALISAYGMYGGGKKALRAFEEMEAAGIIPDHVAFVAVIYACSHSGLVEEGLSCFYRMKKDYSIEPRIEHYACVVDLISRSGKLSKAEEFISSMPLKPDASIWGALLSACRASGDLKVAERISQHIVQLDSDDPGYYILASNVYAALGRWDEVRMIRKSIKARGLKKDPGCSWIEIKNRVYAFATGDKFFQQYEEVKNLLGVLNNLIAKEGYVADLQYALHDVEEDEKMDLLYGHSERLAIAFGLLNTEPGTSLQILKNLRVCGDCHTWTKHISKIVKREILVRDANRFHIFQDGTCSCGDHW
ncbi:hypothetical protein JCGZ_02612 [Jatropha curcas]|uniref:DYW domain-containing protein n=2 Tax=Jatropha curcas TaxID=180498 RepID=A0A067KTV7_JATCU|nr:hypothetical protein JCGZ_02612 [Jatropha curcas]